MKILRYVIMIQLFSAMTFAGNEVGNGGNVVVCKLKNGKIKSVELLDFYEQRIRENKFDTLKDSQKSVNDILDTVLTTLEKLDPKSFKHYQAKKSNFFNEVKFLTESKLIPIDDSKHIVLPKNQDCKVNQIAILSKKADYGKKFLIDKKLWDQMNNNNKAGLVLHEIINEHFSLLGEKDSVKARKVVGLLFGDRIKKMSAEEYWQEIRSLKIPIYR